MSKRLRPFASLSRATKYRIRKRILSDLNADYRNGNNAEREGVEEAVSAQMDTFIIGDEDQINDSEILLLSYFEPSHIIFI